MAAKPLSPEEFSNILEDDFAKALKGVKTVAVGVSGGPDSMALLKCLSVWGEEKGVEIHALSVDHGLRAGSGKEAKGVAAAVKSWPGVTHAILAWKGKKPSTRLMEAARAARHRLMAAYCAKREIKHLFLAHHQNDQAETFLFRLAKGSGLDGLAGMKRVHAYEGLIFVRPFLDIPKERLVATCKRFGVQYIHDPSNEASRFARPRLRKSQKALEAEGLTSKRLAQTAARLERARKTLDYISEKSFENNLLEKNTKRVVLKKSALEADYEEIAFRILILAIKHLRPEEDYLPRMEKIESILYDMLKDEPFRKRTLGGLVFERDDRKKIVAIFIEKGKRR